MDYIEKLEIMTGCGDNSVLSLYYEQAAAAIKAYAGLNNISKLEHFVLDLAAYRIVKRGADYQTSHSENGVSRSWESDMMDAPAGFWKQIDKALETITETGMGWI